MPKEIERKFLVKKLPENLENGNSIQQGYLVICDSGAEVRIRKFNNTYLQTIKSQGTEVREEIEIILTEQQFNSLWPYTKNRRIEKSRYMLYENGYEYEIDIYAGKLENLKIAEIEFDNTKQSEEFVPPQWLGQEVTDDTTYKNQNLAS